MISRRRFVTVGAVGAAAVALGAAVVPDVLATDTDSDSDSEPADATVVDSYDTETVTRRTLSETESVNGTVGFGASRPLGATGEGIVTAAPVQGDVLRPGDVAVRIAQRPVVLVEGATPMYRELRRVASSERDAAGDKLGEQSGDDVRQLQQYLVDAGLDEDGDLVVDGVFGRETEDAVEKWQEFVGHPATGKVDRSQIVFIATPVRVETAPAVGTEFADLTFSGLDAVVTAPVATAKRRFFEPGSVVGIELADRTATDTVSDIERTIDDQGSSSYSVEIAFDSTDDSEGIEVDASAKLTGTRIVAEDVLTVPVRALVALAEGGWALQVIQSGATSAAPVLTGVELGEIVDGLAEVSGIEEGTEVVVPA